ncbi:extracellular solute-binding protein [Paenibacillus oenotherae]|uniref:Maltodextrin-binding protein n=1 Tax=Paenibacillus oenotherae TaxID=1435645 RepID=A0ABS7D799_9BACL|nr:extracellular solute-binding protein [Paenibacillus oenotherae]MBW7475818.1 extracellular solute-binding protein [Paenibacillus oenotherae]
MLRKTSVIVVISILALVVAACGPDRENNKGTDTGKTNSQTNNTEAAKPEELTIWANEAEKELQAIREITEKFTQETGVKVKVVPVNAREQAKSFSLDGPAGRGPDLWWATHNSMGKNVLQGLAEPFNLDEEVLKNYSEDTIKAVTQQGKIYNLPMVVETAVLYYNKELLPEAPETWADLEKFSDTFNDAKKNKYGFILDGINFYYGNMFMQGNGGYVFGYNDEKGYDATDIGLNNEGSVQGAKLIQKWFQKGYIPQSITTDIMDGLFKQGTVGAVVSVPSSLKNYTDSLGDKLGVAPLPKLENGQRPPSFLGIKGWVLSPFSKNKEWGQKLAVYMTNQQSLEHYFETAGEVPATLSGLGSDKITNHPYYSAVAEQVKSATPTPNNPEISQTWEPMKNALIFLSQGNDAKQILDEAVSQIKEQIAINQSKK